VRKAYGATPEARRRSPDFARIIDARAHARLVDVVERSVAAGARIVIGGDHDGESRYLAPTVLADVTPSMPIMADEIFGPVLPVLAYDELDEAVAHVQSGDKPLALYLFARDRTRVERVLRRTSAGGTVINNCLIHLANPDLPFGGVGASGMGSYHGRWGFEAFSPRPRRGPPGRPRPRRRVLPALRQHPRPPRHPQPQGARVARACTALTSSPSPSSAPAPAPARPRRPTPPGRRLPPRPRP
jgi:hypothetical protein